MGLIDTPSGVKCRNCKTEIYESNFLSSSPWSLRKDPISAHFCSEECQIEYSAMQRTKNVEPNTDDDQRDNLLFSEAFNYKRRIKDNPDEDK